MIAATVTGRLGRDAEFEQGEPPRLRFSVASSAYDFAKRERVTTWVSCSLAGKRGEKLAAALAKGTTVAVAGELRTFVGRDGSTGLALDASSVELLSGKRDDASPQRPPVDRERGTGGDDIPF